VDCDLSGLTATITISGATNSGGGYPSYGCSDCASYNGAYVLSLYSEGEDLGHGYCAVAGIYSFNNVCADGNSVEITIAYNPDTDETSIIAGIGTGGFTWGVAYSISGQIGCTYSWTGTATNPTTYLPPCNTSLTMEIAIG